MRKILNILKYLAALAVGGFLFWYVYRDQFSDPAYFPHLKEQIFKLNFWFIGFAFTALMLSNISRGMRWSLLIEPLGHKVTLKNSFLAVMLGYLANLFVPRMGEVSRCVVLNRTNRISVDKLIGTVVIERVIDMLSLLVIVMLTLLLQASQLKTFFSTNISGLLAKRSNPNANLFSTPAIAIGLSITIALIIALFFFLKRYKAGIFFIKAKSLWIGFVDGLKTVVHMKQRWLFFFHLAFIWLMYYLMVYFTFYAMDATAALGALPALTVLVTGSFGFVMPVQGGAGTYDLAVKQTLMLYGLAAIPASDYTFVAHTFQFAVFLIAGLICLVYFVLKFKKIKVTQNEQAFPERLEPVK